MANAQVPGEVIDYIRNEINKTQFGTVTVELNGNKSAVDVVTTCRKRFPKKEEDIKKETVFRDG